MVKYLELPSVPTERADLDGDRVNWPKLCVGTRVVVRCFFSEETESNKEVRSLPFQSVELLETDAAATAAQQLAVRQLFHRAKLAK